MSGKTIILKYQKRKKSFKQNKYILEADVFRILQILEQDLYLHFSFQKNKQNIKTLPRDKCVTDIFLTSQLLIWTKLEITYYHTLVLS